MQTGIGVVAPYDFALDRELWHWAPDDMSLYLTRMPYVPLAATRRARDPHLDAEPRLPHAIDVLAVSPLVTVYACTSAASSARWAAKPRWCRRMEAAGAPAAVATSGALLIALRHLSLTRGCCMNISHDNERLPMS